MIVESQLLIAASGYRALGAIPRGAETLSALQDAWLDVFGRNGRSIIEGNISRASSVFNVAREVRSARKQGAVLVYFFGYSVVTPKGMLLAQPSSTPGRSRTWIDLGELLTETGGSPVIVIVDGISERENGAEPNFGRSVVLVRKTSINRRAVASGADWLTTQLLVALRDLEGAVPQATIQAYLNMVTQRTGLGRRELFDAYGDMTLVSRARLRFPMRKFEVIDLENLLSPNRGSREDGIQSLAEAASHPNPEQRAARVWIEYLSLNDPASEVRDAARITAGGWRRSSARQSSTKGSRPLEPVWREVPAGEFTMGANPSDDPYSRMYFYFPKHQVDLRGFSIGLNPVTLREWQRFRPLPPEVSDRDPSTPMTLVSWYDARQYAEWLTASLRGSGSLSAEEVIRLPTEAEWEKAARGTDGRTYPWGDTFDADCCNYRDNSHGTVVPVGQFPGGTSPYGCNDMAGNVWEWTMSLWGPSGRRPDWVYPYVPGSAREELSAPPNVRRVIRGGAYYYFDYCVAAATRNVMLPDTRHSGGGFRLVRATRDRWPY